MLALFGEGGKGEADVFAGGINGVGGGRLLENVAGVGPEVGGGEEVGVELVGEGGEEGGGRKSSGGGGGDMGTGSGQGGGAS